jgi:hypothetical protein
MGGIDWRLAGGALLAENKPRIVELFLQHKQFAMAPDGASCATLARAISLAQSLHPDDRVLFTSDSASALHTKIILAPPLSAISYAIPQHGPII